MDTITSLVIDLLKYRYDSGDVIDRINYEYTPLILSILSLTLMASQYVGKPIQCWFPAQFTDTWEAYGETYCFIKNTYYLPLTERFPKDWKERDKKEINYYQWVPMVLICQAVCFHTPNLIWRALNASSGQHQPFTVS